MWRREERRLLVHRIADICVAVPVEFGANAVVGEAYVDCLGVSSEDICTDCRLTDAATEPLPDVQG